MSSEPEIGEEENQGGVHTGEHWLSADEQAYQAEEDEQIKNMEDPAYQAETEEDDPNDNVGNPVEAEIDEPNENI